MKFAIALLILTLSLSACGPVISADVQPDVKGYSKQTQNTLADEVESGSCPVSTQFAKDYNIMQEQTLAIGGAK